MPTYEYRCPICEHVVEIINRLIAERDDPVACDECNRRAREEGATERPVALMERVIISAAAKVRAPIMRMPGGPWARKSERRGRFGNE